MNFQIHYHESVIKEDIPRLSASTKVRLKTAIEHKLMTHPETYGKPLRKSLKSYRKLRVGDYRVIFRIQNQAVKVILIQHRSVVYKHAVKRIIQTN
jgi:mRNA interferase RelE/StbE